MQSFRERSGGYHSNQPCYQQEPHELCRLETYRQHPHHPHPQHPHPGSGPHPGPGPGPGHTRSGYEAHSLGNSTNMSTAGGPGTGGGPKDCYNQQAYPGYPGGGNGSGNGSSTSSQVKKPYRGSKVPTGNPGQHLQGPGGYSNHMGVGSYSAQYMSEGHLQQKWEDPTQYDREMVGRMEAAGTPVPGSSQYMDQNMLGHSQTQCPQPSTPAYTSPHHQPHANPAPSPLMYPQSHLHYPQHSPSPSPYMEKCSPMTHCYKGYNMPPNSQYSRQMSSHSKLNQGGYRSSQNSYSYQQPPSRVYEQQPPLQAMTNPQDPHSKYQHYSQAQQNYCLSELCVRSPEQYYQTCSPSSSHSPARSVGRSPSYSSTPSPLMTNPESFQYGQPPMTPGAASSSSSSSASIQEQVSNNTMLMPPRSHPSTNVHHITTHSYITIPQVPSVKDRFSEKLLSNPSLWSLNALTSQVENISNNVQQLLLSEALVANKKGSKRNSGGSNSSGNGASSKKSEEYKSQLYPEGGGSMVSGLMQDPYSTPQHQTLPMELQEGGYSSSSDEHLDRGYYYCGQGRSPAQASSNIPLNLDTASSCSMTSPDDMSTRSGDSGLHNFTPDPTRCQSGLGGDDMSAPVKSNGNERSPAGIIVPSPMKQERDSPSDMQHINVSIKENFEESAWREKSADQENVTIETNNDFERNLETIKSSGNLEKWSDEEKYPALYSKVNKGVTEKGYCYTETLYHEIQSKYASDTIDSTEQSPAALSDSSHKENLGQEMKSDVFISESTTAFESSVKISPFVSRADLEQNQYSTEKEDNSVNTSPSQARANENNSDKRVNKYEEDGVDGLGAEEAKEVEEDEIQKENQHCLSPPLSVEGGEHLIEKEKGSQSLNEEHIINKSLASLCSRTESQSTEPQSGNENGGVLVYPKAAADVSEQETAIADTVPHPQSAMPVFSALNDKATPPAPARDHIDHSDAKVLEPDSPQLPGKSILPSAPSWADTPPSPKKGDEDMEPGISCASAVTPLAKPEPVAPSAQTRAFGRKHARGRRRIMHSVIGIRQELSLEKEGAKEEEEGAPLLTQKPCMPPSKTVLFSDQIDIAHQESIASQIPKMLTDGFRSRMCTRSFNAPDLPPKVEPHVKRKPGPKPGSKTGLKPGSKPGSKPGPKPGIKTGPKPGHKPGLKPGPKTGTKPGFKPGPNPVSRSVSNEPEPPLKPRAPVKRKPGPKPGLKPGSKSVPRPGSKSGTKPGSKSKPNPGPKSADVLSLAETAPIKASVGRPKGSVSKAKLVQQETIQPVMGLQSREKKSLKATLQKENQYVKSANQEDKKINHEAKSSERECKNMVLRSRKSSQGKLPREKEKIKEGDILLENLTEVKTIDVAPIIVESVTAETTVTPIPNAVNNTDVPADSPAPPASIVLPEQSEEKVALPLKRKPSSDVATTPLKKKRGPKPKQKPLKTQISLLEEVPTSEEKVVQSARRKRGQPKKASVVTSSPKDSPPSISEVDITRDVPVVAPHCPTKTKVLPPRKGRGQKYEAMVQKITSPSSKKHLPIPQIDTILSDDVATKNLSQHVIKEGQTSLCNDNEMLEQEITNMDSIQEEILQHSKDEVTQSRETHEMRQVSVPEEVTEQVEEKVVNKTREEIIKQGTEQDVRDGKVLSATKAQLQASTSQKCSKRPSEELSTADTKSTTVKRKRWAMVESTDTSAAVLAAGSLIVATPRLAKQRAIKNNHEMHLKQRRKKRKGQPSTEETETVETNTEVTEQQEEKEEKVTTTETTVPLLISPDEITEAHQDASTESLQKPRRGRKPSVNLTKRKQGTASPEQIIGKPIKVHKKPGPKPGMKDAIEVIEAVVRAAGCEQDEKEQGDKWERKEEKEEVEENQKEKQKTGTLGPVVTISEKQTEKVSMKRIRRKPAHHYSKLSFFPYVRINNSRDFSSWCAIVNRPEDAIIFQRRRKKGILRMRNPFTVAKGVTHSAAMVQGPLINKNITDRCLVCSLCGNPANYRDLGDLCGPYYTEETIPRKMLKIRHTEYLREALQKTSDNNSSSSGAQECSPKKEGEGSTEKEGNVEASSQEGNSSSRRHHWRYRRAGRAERTVQEGGPQRLTLQERLRRLKTLHASSTGASSDQDGKESILQKLQVQAEAKEHWTHENCAIWTKGIIMVAGRLYGLKEAANKSAQTSCYKCQIEGASLSCCWRGCSHKYHYVCAKQIGCTFHEDDFSIKCPKHEDL